MCGVGVISKTFIDCFEEVRRVFKDIKVDLSLHLITQALTDDALGYDENILKSSIKITRKSGGDVHFILNGSNGIEQFGNVDNWNVVSCNAGSKALEISQKYDEAIVIAVDTPFMYTPYYIDIQKKAYLNSNITSVLTLHSDVLSHHPEDPDIKRLAWESSAIKYACLKDSIKIAKTSKFLADHLSKHYMISSDKLLNLQSGINPKSPRYKSWKRRDILKKLDSYKIPLDKDLIFSVGRAVSYKGFDILIKAYAELKTKNSHLVFIASPYKTAPSNVEELKVLIEELGIECTPIFNLDLDLPQAICQWENTKIVAQLSRHEPFGLVPEEVRLWSGDKGPVILTSYCEGYIEQISDGVDGFTVDISEVNSVSKKIDDILSTESSKLKKIKQAGLKRALRDYDYKGSMINLIADVLKVKSKVLQ